MKNYGFKLIDGTCEYVKWFNTDGILTCIGLDKVSQNMAIVIRSQEFLPFHAAFACAKAAAPNYNITFVALTEEDWNKANPIKNLFKNVKNQIKNAFKR